MRSLQPSRPRRIIGRVLPRAVAIGTVGALVALGQAPGVSSAATVGAPGCASEVSDGLTTQTSTVNEGVGTCVVAFSAGTGTWTVPAGITKVKVQLLAGGGGGGNFGGGGGGAVLLQQEVAVTGGAALPVTVGEGGTGGKPGALPTNGADSVFDSVIVKGGGAGGSVVDSSSTSGGEGSAGGTGGGGAPYSTGDSGGLGGTSTATAGSTGDAGGAGLGNTYDSGLVLMVGGGGGGAGGPGEVGSIRTTVRPVGGDMDAGQGGEGVALIPAWVQTLPRPIEYRSVGTGGGGGAAAFGPVMTIGCGVNSLRARGGGWMQTSRCAFADSGEANTGNGGGGGGNYDYAGGNGGSGLVVVWWAKGGGSTGGPTVTPPGPVVADGTTPVVFDVSPTITPGTSPIDPGAICIVDPASSGCETTVTLPTEGIWELDLEAGTLTFTPSSTATPGATESVVLRVTDVSSATAEGTFSVLIPDGSIRPDYVG